MTSGTFGSISIDLITVPSDRQRRELTNIPELAESISARGLINPITITKDHVLVAGERRLQACKSLGWTSITYQYVDDLDPIVLHLIELEENIKRVDITWQDRARAIQTYHALSGQAADGDGEQSYVKTAKAIGLSPNYVRTNVAVAQELAKGNEKIITAPKFSTAVGIIERANERKKAAALEVAHAAMPSAPMIKPTAKPESILNVSFLDWAPGYSGPKFNFIHCDFPYGINADKHVQGAAPTHGGYSDTPETYFTLLRCLSNNLDRIALPSCHIMFWFSMHYYQETLDFFTEQTDFEIDPFPLVWHKTDNSGIIPDPERGPRRVYETALFGARGDRKIARAKSNAYGAPSEKDIHMSIKPAPMLGHFFAMFVDESTLLLDPTCGSGGALRAAENLKAAYVLGLEINSEFADSARQKLEKSRRLRAA